jgi:hypothetical protein
MMEELRSSETTQAAKKYQMRKEARIEFKIVDTVRLGGKDSSLGCKWPETKRGPKLL